MHSILPKPLTNRRHGFAVICLLNNLYLMFLIKYILNEITLKCLFSSARLISFGQLMSGKEYMSRGTQFISIVHVCPAKSLKTLLILVYLQRILGRL